MWCIKSEKEKLRQDGVFLRTSRLALEILWKTLGMGGIPLAFSSKKRGINVLEEAVN